MGSVLWPLMFGNSQLGAGYCGGLHDYQYHFEVHVRYMILELSADGTIFLVVIETPTAYNAGNPVSYLSVPAVVQSHPYLL